MDRIDPPGYAADMTQSRPHDTDAARERSARDDLAALRDAGDVLGSSALARQARRAADHFAARDAGDADPVELWGRRIGRVLGLLACIGLGAYLYLIYMR
jgi:hypothetical protein